MPVNPAPQALDINQLIAQLQQQRQGESTLAGLDQQYKQAEAKALRSNMQQDVNTGGVLGGIANMVRGYNTNRSMKRLEPQQEAARQQIAGSQDAAQIYKFQHALAKEKADRENKLDVQASKNLQKGIDRQNKLTDKKAFAQYKHDNKLYGSGNVPKTPEQYDAKLKQYEASQKRIKETNLALDREVMPGPTAKETAKVESLGLDRLNMDRLFADYKPEYAGAGLGTENLEQWVTRNVPGLATDQMQDAENWFAKFKTLYEIPERHGWFGGALTDKEIAEWQKSATLGPKFTDRQLRARMKTLRDLYTKAQEWEGKNARIKKWPVEWVNSNLGPPPAGAADTRKVPSNAIRDSAPPPLETAADVDAAYNLLSDEHKARFEAEQKAKLYGGQR